MAEPTSQHRGSRWFMTPLRIVGRFIALLVVASLVIFLLLRALPGNPAQVALGVTATPEEIATLSHSLGLDRPLWLQYLDWVSGLLHGDYGTSLTSGQELTPLILERGALSATLGGLAIMLSLALAIPLGIAATSRRWGQLIGAASQLGIALPSFLVAILLIALISVKLGWLPAGGWQAPYAPRLVLPVISLALVQTAILTRYVRSSLLDVEMQDFMRTARSHRQTRWQALFRHGLRNAAIPVLTVTGVQLTSVIVGAVVIERVFVLPGLGTMLLDAVASRDLTSVQAVVMVLVCFTLVVNLLVDLATVAIDPRIRRLA